MSRRDLRDSDSKHHRSRFDREPSPKRSRRDGKPATERPPSNLNLDTAEHSDRDQKNHRRLQDALPLEAPVLSNAKVETLPLSKESDKKSNGNYKETKHSSDNPEAPRSRSFFQHDERRSAGQVGHSFRRRETTEHARWKDSQKDEHRGWRHDGYYKMEADLKPSTKKRPSFREIKQPADDKTATEATKPNHIEHSSRVREPHRNEPQRLSFQTRDRYGSSGGGSGGGGGGGGLFRGRERFNGRQGHRGNGGKIEKWKHDLYDEANKSPTMKNEDDQIAKVEALLAS